MKPVRFFVPFSLAWGLGACAARSAEQKSPAAPPGAYPTSGSTPAAAPAAEMPPPPPPAPPPALPSTTGGAQKAADDPVWLEFERVDREVALSTGDCATACRALGSLERAAKRVCESSARLGDGGHCGEATQRLRDARGRVRAACTRCAGGPSTDPAAPLP